MPKFNDYSIAECMATAAPLVRMGGTAVFQKFTCRKCESRQTIDKPNVFYTHGRCGECGTVTDLQEAGCNYLLHQAGTPLGVEQLKKLYGDIPTELTLYDSNQYLKDHPEERA